MEDKVLFMIITFITIIRTNITKYTFFSEFGSITGIEVYV